MSNSATAEQGMKLLYVNDNPQSEDGLHRKLSRSGAMVSQAQRLDEVFEKLKQDSFDAILLDMTQIGGNCVDACQRLSLEAPNVPVVAVTDYDDDRRGLEAIAAGAQDYIVKSRVDVTDLQIRIRAALARRVREVAALNEKLRSNMGSLQDVVQGVQEVQREVQEQRQKLTLPVWGVPVLPSNEPDRESVAAGKSVSFGPDGFAFELIGNENAAAGKWVVGVEFDDGRMRFACVEVLQISKRDTGRLLEVNYLPEDRDLFCSQNVTPAFATTSRRFELGLPRETLDKWAELGVLEPEFYDTELVCPSCRGTANVRRGCRSCGSARLNTARLLHHFACAHVDQVDKFEQDGHIVCPKCRARDLVVGADFEYLPGPLECRDCSWSDTEAEFVGECLACQRRFNLQQALEHKLARYHINRLKPTSLLEQ